MLLASPETRLVAVCPQSPTVTRLSPSSFKELESQLWCLEKEATELKEAVEHQKVKNNVSIGDICTQR